MKKLIKIPTYQIGLVFKDMKLVKVLTEGSTYWRKWGETVEKYSVFVPFQLTTRNSILINDELLQPYLNVFEIKENELLFKFQGDLFQEVFKKGVYAFWKNPLNETYEIVDTNEIEVPKKLVKLYKNNSVLQNYMTRYDVLSHESAILLEDEQFVKVLGSGSYIFWKNNTKVELKKVDLRQQMIEINGQEILTQDKANLRINMDAKFAVTDVMKALLDNKNFANMLYILLQSKLRAYVGQYTLDQLLEQKSDIGKDILATVVDQAKSLGVKVFQTEIRDVILPGDVKDIMNQVLVAQKRAQANTITRREETAATRSLLNTAKLMEDNPMLYQLKEMEYVEKIADKIGEITVSGNGGMIKQIKDIFAVKT